MYKKGTVDEENEGGFFALVRAGHISAYRKR